MPPHLTRAVLYAAAPLLALSLAGCGDSSPSASNSTTYVEKTVTQRVTRSGSSGNSSNNADDNQNRPAGSLPAPAMSFTTSHGARRVLDRPSAFISERATTQCLVSASGVICEPHTLWSKGPAGNASTPGGYCPDGRASSGVQLGNKGNAWYCGPADPANPVRGSEAAAWAEESIKTTAGMVVLPFGQTIIVGSFECSDFASGVECRRSGSDEGFRIMKAGVTWSLTKPGYRSQYS